MSIIGALEKLEVLKLVRVEVSGETWETKDDEFQKLKYLKLDSIEDFEEWNISSWEPFPELRHLIINCCYDLEEIPSEIGSITTLQLISVSGCTPQLKKSVRKLQEQMKEEGNEDVTIMVMEEVTESKETFEALEDLCVMAVQYLNESEEEEEEEEDGDDDDGGGGGGELEEDEEEDGVEEEEDEDEDEDDDDEDEVNEDDENDDDDDDVLDDGDEEGWDKASNQKLRRMMKLLWTSLKN